jgi:protein-disulfide isomerase
MDNLTKNTIALAISFLLILGAFYFSNYDGQAETNNNQPENQEAQEEVNLAEKVDWNKGISFGDSEAPVKIVNFSSYSCPYCTKFEEEVFSELKEEYIDSGEVFYLFRGLGDPTSPVYQSLFCLDEQLSREDLLIYQNILFSDRVNQNSDADDLLAISNEEGFTVNEDDFKICLEENRYQEEIESAGLEARDLQLQGTPYLLVGGKEVVGFRGFEEYKQIIDQKLNENN